MPPNLTSRRDFLKAASASALASAVLPWRTGGSRRRRSRSHEDYQGAGRPLPGGSAFQGIAPNCIWVRLHTGKGIVGIGES